MVPYLLKLHSYLYLEFPIGFVRPVNMTFNQVDKSLFLNITSLILIGLTFATGVMSTCLCSSGSLVGIFHADIGKACIWPSACATAAGCFTNKHVVQNNNFNLCRYCSVNIEVTSMINSAVEGELVQCKYCNCQSGWTYNLLTVPVN